MLVSSKGNYGRGNSTLYWPFEQIQAVECIPFLWWQGWSAQPTPATISLPKLEDTRRVDLQNSKHKLKQLNELWYSMMAFTKCFVLPIMISFHPFKMIDCYALLTWRQVVDIGTGKVSNKMAKHSLPWAHSGNPSQHRSRHIPARITKASRPRGGDC